MTATAEAVRERPILFSGDMVRAILRGSKTQTRRVVRGRALDWLAPDMFVPSYVARPDNHMSPYGYAGDRLWVRENWLPDVPLNGWADDLSWDGCGRPANGVPVRYRSPGHCLYAASWTGGSVRWKPSIHMPRWACRLTLRVTDVRIERVQEISEPDARDEGVERHEDDGAVYYGPCGQGHADAAFEFRRRWNLLNEKRGYGWDANPWVWVVSFEPETIC